MQRKYPYGVLTEDTRLMVNEPIHELVVKDRLHKIDLDSVYLINELMELLTVESLETAKKNYAEILTCRYENPFALRYGMLWEALNEMCLKIERALEPDQESDNTGWLKYVIGDKAVIPKMYDEETVIAELPKIRDFYIEKKLELAHELYYHCSMGRGGLEDSINQSVLEAQKRFTKKLHKCAIDNVKHEESMANTYGVEFDIFESQSSLKELIFSTGNKLMGGNELQNHGESIFFKAIEEVLQNELHPKIKAYLQSFLDTKSIHTAQDAPAF